MNLKKSWIKASENRVSRRTYIEKDIKKEDIESIINMIDSINNEARINIQFVEEGKEIVSGFKASYGMINGVKSFIALVANKDIENYKQKLGYYGEMLVLEATDKGLSTCWLGGTYKKKECEKHINIKENEELVCIIAVGYTEEELSIKEKLVKTLNKKEKSTDEILKSKDSKIPTWVLSGAQFILDAPSAVNARPVVYKYEDNKVEAIIAKPNHGYEEVDLGISMLHFELGAYSEGYSGNWKCENKQYTFN
ncbi:nitroreductase family protein [Romboutsia sp.]|uniref:nitroreductase family protein n=1 Tax=Romboutsia sp. TaxID=1965302 RepID=UPI003F37A1E2